MSRETLVVQDILQLEWLTLLYQGEHPVTIQDQCFHVLQPVCLGIPAIAQRYILEE